MSIAAGERLRLMRQADAIWGGLKAAFDALTDEQIDRPNTIGAWSARDVMVHVANWEEEAARYLREWDAGREPTPTMASVDELDAWNEAHVAPLRTVSLDDARLYIDRYHLELMVLLLTAASVPKYVALGSYPGHLDDLLNLATARE